MLKVNSLLSFLLSFYPFLLPSPSFLFPSLSFSFRLLSSGAVWHRTSFHQPSLETCVSFAPLFLPLFLSLSLSLSLSVSFLFSKVFPCLFSFCIYARFSGCCCCCCCCCCLFPPSHLAPFLRPIHRRHFGAPSPQSPSTRFNPNIKRKTSFFFVLLANDN